MPTWTTCYDNVVIGRVMKRWRVSPYRWDEDLAVDTWDLLEGTKNSGEALVYSYAYLNHHVGGAGEALRLTQAGLSPFPECVMIDYGCGPGTALMALAETEFRRTSRPLKVRYIGVEMPNSPAVEIAQDLFACIQREALITQDSTMTFHSFGTSYALPALASGLPVFYVLCYVLAHSFYEKRATGPGLPVWTDPVLDLARDISRCRQHYARPVQLVYVNATKHIRPVHAAWKRLTDALRLGLNIRDLPYNFAVYGSERITGQNGSLEDWRAARFQNMKTTARKTASCDWQVLL